MHAVLNRGDVVNRLDLHAEAAGRDNNDNQPLSSDTERFRIRRVLFAIDPANLIVALTCRNTPVIFNTVLLFFHVFWL